MGPGCLLYDTSFFIILLQMLNRIFGRIYRLRQSPLLHHSLSSLQHLTEYQDWDALFPSWLILKYYKTETVFFWNKLNNVTHWEHNVSIQASGSQDCHMSCVPYPYNILANVRKYTFYICPTFWCEYINLSCIVLLECVVIVKINVIPCWKFY